MEEIRLLSPAEVEQYADIGINAYPGYRVTSSIDRQRVRQRYLSTSREARVEPYGLFRDGQLLGAMRLYDFTMTVRDTPVPVQGVGAVAVDLLYKKQKVARNLIRFFLRHARQRGTPLAILYPFRPDFYRRMGFGYGTKLNQYRVRPTSLPRVDTIDHLAFASRSDKRALLACYNRYTAVTNGMIKRTSADFDPLFENVELRTIVYREGKQLRGYLTFSFKPGGDDNFLDNDLQVRELVYETPQALAELLTFLHLQLDQVNYVYISVQDGSFHYLLSDPRRGHGQLMPPLYHESNIQGVGLMYRVVDVPGIFEKLARHNFAGQDCRLRITVADSFLPENAGSTVIHFKSGAAHLAVGDHDVEICLEICDFSSLLMGAVSFRTLVRYARAQISHPAHLDTVDRLFAVTDPPVCMTVF